jgi:nucleoside-diphosphate-sugar epimerase
MKIIVTGGSGFIGTNLVSMLISKGIDVVNFDIVSPKLESHKELWVEVDICNKSQLSLLIARAKPDYIVHLAARTDLYEQSSLDGYSANICGVRNIMDAAATSNTLTRIIIASSMLVCKLGYIPTGFDDYAPNSLYAESKVLTEKIVKEYKIDWVIVRPTSIWGPWFGEPYKNFFDLVVKGLYFNIPSNHSSTKTYGYVENTCMQIFNLLLSTHLNVRSNYFYLGDFEPLNITNWASRIRKLNNQTPLIILPKWSLFCAAMIGDFLNFCFGLRKFPMSSFRYNNMTNDNVIGDLQRTVEMTKIGADVNLDDQITKTLVWLNLNNKHK